jgi:predicted transcriptional regulator
VTGLGELERAVMEAIWAKQASSTETAVTARDVSSTLPNHAYTTVLTILGRLCRKGLVEAVRDGKTHHYFATGSRESYIAQLMHEALDATSDREAALVHFARSVDPAQARILRSVLDRLDDETEP